MKRRDAASTRVEALAIFFFMSYEKYRMGSENQEKNAKNGDIEKNGARPHFLALGKLGILFIAKIIDKGKLTVKESMAL
jgi:hypothetical protein